MVILNELFEDSKLSEVPLTKILFYKHGTSTSALGLKKGVVLPEDESSTRRMIVVIEGEIELNTPTNSHHLHRFDTFDVPIHVSHSIKAVFDAVFIIIQDDPKNQMDG